MNIINKIGLEVEFFLCNKKDGKLVYPSDYGFETDDFIILGEFRCEPGNTREEVIGNYYKELSKVLLQAEEVKLIVNFGYKIITPEFLN
jgi:hypothetical protein